MIAKNKSQPGTLYVVATPIGNLEDITLRALRILEEVDLIAAEDTRHSKKLLTHYNIKTKLISYYREKEQQRSEQLLEKLQTGINIALISDAGTPGISDPGSILIRKAREHALEVVPLPGASALTTALCVSGMIESPFLFLGFLPAKKSQRRKIITSHIHSSWALVFYESPHRVKHLLSDLLSILGDRKAFWARELTKRYEDLQAASLSQLLAEASRGKNRGEFVLIVQGAEEEKMAIEQEDLDELLAWYRDNTELTLKDVVKKINSDLGLPRSQVYRKALEIFQEANRADQ